MAALELLLGEFAIGTVLVHLLKHLLLQFGQAGLTVVADGTPSGLRELSL